MIFANWRCLAVVRVEVSEFCCCSLRGRSVPVFFSGFLLSNRPLCNDDTTKSEEREREEEDGKGRRKRKRKGGVVMAMMEERREARGNGKRELMRNPESAGGVASTGLRWSQTPFAVEDPALPALRKKKESLWKRNNHWPQEAGEGPGAGGG
jgi:hypothetical protein